MKPKTNSHHHNMMVISIVAVVAVVAISMLFSVASMNKDDFQTGQAYARAIDKEPVALGNVAENSKACSGDDVCEVHDVRAIDGNTFFQRERIGSIDNINGFDYSSWVRAEGIQVGRSEGDDFDSAYMGSKMDYAQVKVSGDPGNGASNSGTLTKDDLTIEKQRLTSDGQITNRYDGIRLNVDGLSSYLRISSPNGGGGTEYWSIDRTGIVHQRLGGQGFAFVCVDEYGELIRSDTSCDEI